MRTDKTTKKFLWSARYIVMLSGQNNIRAIPEKYVAPQGKIKNMYKGSKKKCTDVLKAKLKRVAGAFEKYPRHL